MTPLRLRALLGALAAALAGCGAQPPAEDPRADRQDRRTEVRAGATERPRARVANAPAAAAPYLAVNRLDALLPLGPTRGRLAIAAGCVAFKVRDQLYTPVWPAGSRVSPDGTRIFGPAGESFVLGEDATLAGASFSLAGMRLERPLARGCPLRFMP